MNKEILRPGEYAHSVLERTRRPTYIRYKPAAYQKIKQHDCKPEQSRRSRDVKSPATRFIKERFRDQQQAKRAGTEPPSAGEVCVIDALPRGALVVDCFR